MGKGNKISVGSPINEAVFLLNEFDPKRLAEARLSFPQIESELVLGRMGGEKEESSNLEIDRAKFMLSALNVAKKEAERSLSSIRGKINSSRKLRLGSQVASVVCSSGVLAAVKINDKATIVTAFLSLIASIGTLISEHKERLLSQSKGNIYDAFEQASQAVYKAGIMGENIRLQLKHKAELSEIRDSIKTANELCEELSRLLIQIKGSS